MVKYDYTEAGMAAAERKASRHASAEQTGRGTPSDVDDLSMDVASPAPGATLTDGQLLTVDDFTNSEQKELTQGDAWYVIPQHAYNLYKNRSKGNSNLIASPVDCTSLLETLTIDDKLPEDPDSRNPFHQTDLRTPYSSSLRRNIQENVDYALCSQELFEKIQLQYSVADRGRDVIRRKVVREGKYRTQLTVELHPLRLQAAFFNPYSSSHSRYQPPDEHRHDVLIEEMPGIWFEISTTAKVSDLKAWILAKMFKGNAQRDYEVYLRFASSAPASPTARSKTSDGNGDSMLRGSRKRTTRLPQYTPLEEDDHGLEIDLGITDNCAILVLDTTQHGAKSKIYGDFVDASGHATITKSQTSSVSTVISDINHGKSDTTKQSRQISVFQETSPSDQTKPGQTGLSNMGNTCFMASGLQCMSNLPMITQFFLDGTYLTDLNEDNPLGCQGRLAQEYASLLRQIWSGQHSSITPRTFKKTLAQFCPRFSGYQQQDSHEFIAFLLDGLHEDLNRIKKKPYIELKDAEGRPDSVVSAESWKNHLCRNNSMIVDNFHGQFKSTVKCPTCEKISVTFDPFCYLTLPLNTSGSSVMSGLSKLAGNRIFGVTKTSKTWLEDQDSYISVIFVADVDDTAKKFTAGNWVKEIQVPLKDIPRDAITKKGIECKSIIAVVQEQLNSFYKREVKKEQVHRKERQGNEDMSDYEDIVLNDLIEGQHLNLVSIQAGIVEKIYNKSDKVPLEKLPNAMDRNGTTALCCYAVPDITENDQITIVYFQHEAKKRGGMVFVQRKQEFEKSNLCSLPVLIKMKKKKVWYKDIRALIDKHIFPKFHSARCYDPDFNNGNIQFDLATVRDNSKKYTELEDQDRNVVDVSEWEADQTRIVAEFNETSSNAYTKAMKILLSQGSIKKSGTPTGGGNLNTIQKCIEQFLLEEELEEEDAWYCPRCKSHQQASKKFDLWKLPPILTIHLKRFGTQRYMFSSRKKVKTKIEFPLEHLKLEDFMLGECNKKDPPTYNLIGVSNHMGEMGFGHYTAYARSIRDNNWYGYDDSHVRRINESEVVSANAYVLIYCQSKMWEHWLEKGPCGINTGIDGS